MVIKKKKQSQETKGGVSPVLRREIESRIARVKRLLDEMREYKRVLQADGLEPDADDKVKESGLIKHLLSMEKQLGIKPLKKTGPRKAGAKGSKKPGRTTNKKTTRPHAKASGSASDDKAKTASKPKKKAPTTSAAGKGTGLRRTRLSAEGPKKRSSQGPRKNANR